MSIKCTFELGWHLGVRSNFYQSVEQDEELCMSSPGHMAEVKILSSRCAALLWVNWAEQCSSDSPPLAWGEAFLAKLEQDGTHQLREHLQLHNALRVCFADLAPGCRDVLQQRLLQLHHRVLRHLSEPEACLLGAKLCLHAREAKAV